MAKTKEQLRKTEVGHLEIPGGAIDITDPCYSRDAWCRINSLPVKSGKYACTAWTGSIDEWGERVYALAITYSDIPKGLAKALTCIETSRDEYRLSTQWEQVGTVGVDAGLCGFFVNHDAPKEQSAWLSWLSRMDSEFTTPTDDVYLSPDGFWSASGVGDGEYSVFMAKDSKGAVIALCLVFM